LAHVCFSLFFFFFLLFFFLTSIKKGEFQPNFWINRQSRLALDQSFFLDSRRCIP
jgi:hypothetical protein